MSRVGAPSDGSILMTSAPSPASNKPQYSAVSSATSMTVTPESIPGASDGARSSAVAWRSVVLTDSSVMMMCAGVQAEFAALTALIGEASAGQENALYAII